MALTVLHKRLTGKLTPIVAAPPRIVLKAFGGYMDIDEYRAASKESKWSLPPPRMVTAAQVVHERKLGESKRKSSALIQDLSADVDLGPTLSTKPVETFKLRRPKPAKKASNMLEITLGLVNSASK